jgi:hypothetical protein
MGSTQRIERQLSFLQHHGARFGCSLPRTRWYRYGNRLYAYSLGTSDDFPDARTGLPAYGTVIYEQIGEDDDDACELDVALVRSHRLKRDAVTDARDLFFTALREDGRVAPPGARSYYVACGSCGAEDGKPDADGCCTACSAGGLAA